MTDDAKPQQGALDQRCSKTGRGKSAPLMERDSVAPDQVTQPVRRMAWCYSSSSLYRARKTFSYWSVAPRRERWSETLALTASGRPPLFRR